MYVKNLKDNKIASDLKNFHTDISWVGIAGSYLIENESMGVWQTDPEPLLLLLPSLPLFTVWKFSKSDAILVFLRFLTYMISEFENLFFVS